MLRFGAIFLSAALCLFAQTDRGGISGAAGVLPVNFFRVPLPQNFWSMQPQSFDITTVQGYKLFRLRQTYNTAFGDLYQNGSSRYIQFGVKFYF
jgi:hypothetical protein